MFGLIDRARIVRKTRDGRMQDVEITLSDWVFNAIRSREVLTLHRDYFRLRKPLERRIYELARKHSGQKDEWRISLELLQKKCGSNSTSREFRRMVSAIVEQDRVHGYMPDYAVSFWTVRIAGSAISWFFATGAPCRGPCLRTQFGLWMATSTKMPATWLPVGTCACSSGSGVNGVPRRKSSPSGPKRTSCRSVGVGSRSAAGPDPTGRRPSG